MILDETFRFSWSFPAPLQNWARTYLRCCPTGPLLCVLLVMSTPVTHKNDLRAKKRPICRHHSQAGPHLVIVESRPCTYEEEELF